MAIIRSVLHSGGPPKKSASGFDLPTAVPTEPTVDVVVFFIVATAADDAAFFFLMPPPPPLPIPTPPMPMIVEVALYFGLATADGAC